DTVTFSGLVDAYYSYNSNTPGPNSPQAGLNTYHNFDYKANNLDVSLVELNLIKPVDDKNPAGFYFGLVFGPAADAIACVNSATAPAVATCTTGSAEAPYKNFRQAYASLLLAPGLQLDFGKFVTQHGAEVIESNANWNYTRSILFAWAIPYYHSGARLTYTLNEQLTLMGDVVNGWNNTVDTNNGKTYGVQAMVTPVKPLPIIINYMTGPEGVDTRSLLDIVATYYVTDSLSLMANYDDGTQKQATGTGTPDAKWSGYAVYAKYAFTPSLAAVVRYEQFDDKDSFMTGTVQKLNEGTLTLEHATAGGCLIRLDLRQDKSDKTPFTKEDGTPTDTQNTVTLGIVQTF
ncbi:MAG: porin, partial [Nitrospirae bacterium]|nr:porin [Nitrospirota bacterium]